MRKNTRIFVLGHKYLFLNTYTFPQAMLLENCLLFGTVCLQTNILAYFHANWRLLSVYKSLFVPEISFQVFKICKIGKWWHHTLINKILINICIRNVWFFALRFLLLINVSHRTNLTVLLPWQHTGFQTTPKSKGFLANFSIPFLCKFCYWCLACMIQQANK